MSEKLDLDQCRDPYNIDHVIAKVADMIGVTPSEIKSKRRFQHLKEARWLVAWLLRRHTRYTYSVIGAALAHHHATMIWGVRRLEELAAREEVVRRLQAELELHFTKRAA